MTQAMREQLLAAEDAANNTADELMSMLTSRSATEDAAAEIAEIARRAADAAATLARLCSEVRS